jgi:hypothetical protein
MITRSGGTSSIGASMAQNVIASPLLPGPEYHSTGITFCAASARWSPRPGYWTRPRASSLRDRAALDPHSPSRSWTTCSRRTAPPGKIRRPIAPQLAPAGPAGTGKPSRTSQISPSTATVPIRSIGWGLSGEPLIGPEPVGATGFEPVTPRL